MTDLMTSMNALTTKKYGDVADTDVFVLNRWLSGTKENLSVCRDVAFYYGWTSLQTMKVLLGTGIIRSRFIKFPKAAAKDDADALLITNAALALRMPSAEARKNERMIRKLGTPFIEWVRDTIGMTKKECKQFGIEYPTIERQIVLTQRTKGLM